MEPRFSATMMSSLDALKAVTGNLMVYALSLFAWGAYSNQLPFRFMGSAVIIITSIKVFLEDIRGTSNIYIALFLLVIGLIVLLIARIDRYWRDKHKQLRKSASIGAEQSGA